MITRIREVRRAKGMTLDDVARACIPPTTPQTVGRLETGTRTVSVGWLNRIAAALGGRCGRSGDRRRPQRVEGGGDPRRQRPRQGASQSDLVVPPKPAPGLVALTVAASVGDYRAGDEIWCAPIEPEDYGRALNRDVLVPRPAGRFLFGRLIGREGGKLHLLPPGAGGRQQVVTDPPWAAMAVKLVRSL